MVLCTPMPWAVVLCLMSLLCAVYAQLYVCNIISLCYALLYGYIGYKNRACYRLNIWGYAYLLRVHATILAHMIVQLSADFKKIPKSCKCWVYGLYRVMFICVLHSALHQKRGVKNPVKFALKIWGENTGFLWVPYGVLHFPKYNAPPRSAIHPGGA